MKTYKIDPLNKRRPVMLVRGTRIPEVFPDSIAENLLQSLNENRRGLVIGLKENVRWVDGQGNVSVSFTGGDNPSAIAMFQEIRNQYQRRVVLEDENGEQFAVETTDPFKGSQFGGNYPYYTGAYKDLKNFVKNVVSYTGQPMLAEHCRQWYSYTTPEGVTLTFRGCIQAQTSEENYAGLSIDKIELGHKTVDGVTSEINEDICITLDCDTSVLLGMPNGMRNAKPYNFAAGIGWLQIVATDELKSHLSRFNESDGNGDSPVNGYSNYDGFTYNVVLSGLLTRPDSYREPSNNAFCQVRVKADSALCNSTVGSPVGYAAEEFRYDMSYPLDEEEYADLSPTVGGNTEFVHLEPNYDEKLIVVRCLGVTSNNEFLHVNIPDNSIDHSGLVFASMDGKTWLGHQLQVGANNIQLPNVSNLFAFFYAINRSESLGINIQISRTVEEPAEPTRTPGFYSADGTLLKEITKDEVEANYYSGSPADTDASIKNATEIVFPEGVTKIGDNAFKNCTGLTSVTIPDTVTSLGLSAFNGCTGLTSVTLPSTAPSLGNMIFKGCTSLTSITIPEGVTKIGSMDFSDCTSLTSVTIPSTVTTIDTYAFKNCTALNPLVVPNAVATIGQNAFQNVPRVVYAGTATGSPWGATEVLTEAPVVPGFYDANGNLLKAMTKAEVEQDYSNDDRPASDASVRNATEFKWPEGVTKIGDNVFKDCTNLTSITIPEGVTEIGESAVKGCTALTSVTIPEGVTEIGYFAFQSCTNLTSVIIPEGVTTIADYTFAGCTDLTSVTIPSTVTSIDSNAFDGCTGLNPLVVPSTVTTIGQNAFQNVPRVIYAGTAEGSPWGATEHLTEPPRTPGFYDAEGTLLKAMTKADVEQNYTSDGYPSATDESVKNATEFVWPEDVTKLGSHVFDGCTGLTTVTIPEGVTSIAAFTFNGCTGLTSVTIPEGVTSIAKDTFHGCHELTSVTIPSTVTSIGSEAFCFCSKLATVNVPNAVTEIGSDAFKMVKKVIYAGTATGSPWGALTVSTN